MIFKSLLFVSFSLGIFLFSGCTKQKNQLTLEQISTQSKEESTKGTTIHDAVRINDIKLLNTFIQEGADINKKDKFGYTPLHLAVRFNHYEIAKVLVEKGANVNTKDNYGDTPLIDSTRKGFTYTSKLLICNKAKIDVADKDKMTPLDYASKTNDVYISKLLRSGNIDDVCLGKKEESPVKSEFYDLITIDDYDIVKTNTPQICGDILGLGVQRIQITFDEGKSVTDANIDGNRWCAQTKIQIPNGKYIVMVMAINNLGQRGMAKDELIIDSGK